MAMTAAYGSGREVCNDVFMVYQVNLTRKMTNCIPVVLQKTNKILDSVSSTDNE